MGIANFAATKHPHVTLESGVGALFSGIGANFSAAYGAIGGILQQNGGAQDIGAANIRRGAILRLGSKDARIMNGSIIQNEADVAGSALFNTVTNVQNLLADGEVAQYGY